MNGAVGAAAVAAAGRPTTATEATTLPRTARRARTRGLPRRTSTGVPSDMVGRAVRTGGRYSGTLGASGDDEPDVMCRSHDRKDPSCDPPGTGPRASQLCHDTTLVERL